MSDLSDVEDTLVDTISAILYPNGTSNPSIVEGVDAIRVYAGWPVPPAFEMDIKNNISHVSIFPTNSGRNTTRFPQVWHEMSIDTPTITLTVSNGMTVEVGGTVTIPQSCMIIVNNISYAYQISEADTLTTIATALSDLIPNSTSSGAVITINGAFSIVARVTVSGVGIKEIKRQEVVINIITWTNSRNNRTEISENIELGLGALDRILMPDNYYAPILYSGQKDHDEFEKTFAIYRRDLMFKIEYASTIQKDFTTITDFVTDISIVNKLS